MAVYRPGDTVRLTDWIPTVNNVQFTQGAQSAASAGGWFVSDASANNPKGWVVTKISGEYGNPDLVVDVTIPTNFKGVRDYRSHIGFRHGRFVGSETRDSGTPRAPGVNTWPPGQSFVVDTEALTEPWRPAYDFRLHNEGELMAVNVQPDGVHLYSILSGLEFFEDRCTVENTLNPTIDFDEAGRIFLLAVERAERIEQYKHKLWVSNDGGFEFEPVAGLWPYVSSISPPTITYIRYGTIIVTGVAETITVGGGTSVTARAYISFDYGETWEAWGTGSISGRLWLMRDGHLHTGNAGYNLKREAQFSLQQNLGFVPNGNRAFVPRTSDLVSYKWNFTDPIYAAKVKTYTTLSSGPNFPSYSVQWEQMGKIATAWNVNKHNSMTGALLLVHNPRSGRMIAGNGRLDSYADYHFSDDMGRTWLAKVPVEE